MFLPPRCPYRSCRQHARPEPAFFRRHGCYTPRCRPMPVPRFRCKTCRRTFSRQTFRMDFRDHRPHLNPQLMMLLSSGLGLRQSARLLQLSRRCAELKARKLGRHLRRFNLNLRGPLREGAKLQFDELETYEGRRNTRPLSVPVLIEAESRYIIWAEAAPIRPRGKMTPARRAAIAAEELRFGPRKDLSRRSCKRTLKRGADLARNLTCVNLATDEKTTYPTLAAQAFGTSRLAHSQSSSVLPRNVRNPLFSINHTEAMARDLMGRLRRESWLVSKQRRFLDIALQVHMAYRNYVRRRTNRDDQSSAQRLGFAPRRMSPQELLSWRQDGGELSIHPLSQNGECVRDWRAAERSAA